MPVESEEFTVTKCGVSLRNSSIVVIFSNSEKKVKRRTIHVRPALLKKNEEAAVRALRKHEPKSRGLVLKYISDEQIAKLLAVLKDPSSIKTEKGTCDTDTDAKTPNDESDLNKLDDSALQVKKAEMDIDFQKNQVKPGDPDYKYDIEVEFSEPELEVGDTGDWDDDDDAF